MLDNLYGDAQCLVVEQEIKGHFFVVINVIMLNVFCFVFLVNLVHINYCLTN